jgi:hypothetical protein
MCGNDLLREGDYLHVRLVDEVQISLLVPHENENLTPLPADLS